MFKTILATVIALGVSSAFAQGGAPTPDATPAPGAGAAPGGAAPGDKPMPPAAHDKKMKKKHKMDKEKKAE